MYPWAIKPVRLVLDRRNAGAASLWCRKYCLHQPFGCLPNHIVGKGVIKELRRTNPGANIIAVDYDPGASEVNQLNRIKLMLGNRTEKLNCGLKMTM